VYFLMIFLKKDLKKQWIYSIASCYALVWILNIEY